MSNLHLPPHYNQPSLATPRNTAPRASSHPNTARVSAQNLSRMAKQLGRCGDINPLTGYVCAIPVHDKNAKHTAIQIGGPNDGKIYSEW
jgi:hypothetical protein